MGSEAAELSEEKNISTLKLPLLNTIPTARTPDRSGMLTPPPLHTTASVPFRWEEEPGKPRPCTALIPADPKNHKLCLELPIPPRLQIVEYSSKLTKMPSPTTVLDGPYIFHSSSSFRFRRDHHQLPQRWGSFSFGSSGGSPERGLLSAVVLSNSSSRTPEEGKERRGGFFGSCGSSSGKLNLGRGAKKGRRRGGSFDFSCGGELEGSFGGEQSSSSSSCSASGGGGGAARVKKMPRFRRNGSFSNLSHVRSHFWATICEGFKQVLPWKSSRK